jgi:pyruvate/2-oxoglutarate dehydrogenase complex dihydrolipoamide acyltransferase (E2) component
MKTVDGITIDREFKNLIPTIGEEERKQLEANIVEFGGARDPLVVWRTDDSDILIDGHNRHEICTRLGLDYSVEPMEFASRDDAADWIDRNQLGRRNLSRQDYKLLLGRRYNRAKKAVPNPEGAGGKSGKIVSGQNVHQQKTAEKLAKEHGVDEKTVRRAGQFQAAAEKLGIEKQIAAGKVKATEAEVVKAAKSLPPKPTKQQVETAREEVVADRPKRRQSKPAVDVFKAYPPTRCLDAVTFYAQEFLERCPSRAGELRFALVDLIASCDSIELSGRGLKKGL